MKRITELTYTQLPGPSRAPPAAATTTREPTVDEFTVHEDKEPELKCAKPRVEQVFQVSFTIIGLLDPNGAHGSQASRQIWLQLKGKKEDVSKAKEYVKGLCDPELQEEERYPVDMHCIFVGAGGLFLDHLLRDTSAEVQVLEPGRLRLLGCAEAVVMAQSRVQQFVALFQEKRSMPADREPSVKRTFKTFVEERADKYTMELLLLPSALKEELLGLVHSPTQHIVVGLEQDRSQTSTPVTDLSNQILVASFEDKASSRDKKFEDKLSRPVSVPDVLVLNGRPNHKRRSSESEQRDTKRQYSLERWDEEQDREKQKDRRARTRPLDKSVTLVQDSGETSDEEEAVSPKTNLRCLVNFFKTMGYPQDVVERVVRETGQTEDTFLLLERIVAESKRVEKTQDASTMAKSAPTTSDFNSTCVRLKEKEHVQGRALTEIKLKENIRVPSSNGWSQKSQTIPTISLDSDDDVVEVGRKCRTVGPLERKPDSMFDYLSRGGSQTVGPTRMETVMPLRSSATESRPGCSYQTISTRLSPVRTEPPAPPKAIPLTGMSRFQQSLRTPYRLALKDVPGRSDLRHVIIDGSNVAMAHGLHRVFSCRGIAIAVEAFWQRGHREITVFVPQWRQKRDPNITEQHLLNQLEDLRLLSFTPSREVCGQRIASHDDRFLLHLAEKTGGIIVTNDNLRDFVAQSDAWAKIIKERILQFIFVEDHFMIPDDPLGKRGPHLDHFLHKDSRPNVVTPPLRRDLLATSHPPHFGPPDWHPPHPPPNPPSQRSPLETTELKRRLYDIFPDQKQLIDRILNENPYMRDLNALSGLLLG
ncbi:NEDD4-binding protein 1 [Trichomycterus rosablanca]|uniref:NEDD4-binding protein 1 n=1 Tax=Trichomycterus rosablanca TaxID=2290929 RepID=UPI002F34F121